MVKVRILQADNIRVSLFDTKMIRVSVPQPEILIKGEHEPYLGVYNVTPDTHPVTLYTKDKTMNNDVTVFSIPYWETSNESGTTAIIGGNGDYGV